MRRVVLNMQSFLCADAIMRTMHEEGDFDITIVQEPDEVEEQCQAVAANIVLLEVKGEPFWRYEDRLQLRGRLKKILPECKVVLLVDEENEKKAAWQIRQAKVDGLIEQFIFGSSSAGFLAALLDTL